MPSVITVTNTADTGYGVPSVPGSLRAAIEIAQPGDTIQFDPSLANQTITLERRYDIEKDITIDGANASGLTLSGNQEQIIFRLAGDGREFTLRNLTIEDAFHEYTGAGIWAADPNAVITVENSAFNNNIAGQGPAIWAKDGANVTVLNSKFDGNRATQDTDSAGGAVSVFGKSQLTVQGSEFTNNEGFAGGAITTVFTPLTIEDSVFRNNESRSWGGAVNNDGASVPNQERYYSGDLPRDSVGGETIIRNSIFEDNTAVGLGGGVAIWGYDQDFVTIEGSTFINNEVTPDAQGNARGGGLRVTGKLVTIENSTIANNTSAQEGGGLWYWEESPFNIINTTFSGNEAAERGGAIYNAQWGSETNIVNTTFANNYAGSESGAIYTGNARPVIVTNSIFDNNTAGDGSNPNQQTNRELTGGNNLQSPGSGNNVTENITIVDPLLGALQDIGGSLIHPLLPGSPAIDAGSSAGDPGTDQTGAVRPQDGDLNGSALIDIGAYESPGTLLTPEIQVLDGATNIVDGTTAALDFGNTLIGTPLVKAFTLINSGTAELNLSELQLPTGFSLVGTLPTSVAAGGETALAIQLDAAAVGTATGEITFAANDSDENPFNFAISGNVSAATSPEIQVLDGNTDIVDGSTVALDFGSTSVGSTLTKTFSIQNLGTAVLNLETPGLPEGFSIEGDFPSTVAAGDSASFTLALDTAIAGTYSGTVTFGNNDSDESPFDFTISGNVDSPTVLNPINGTDLSETLVGTAQDDWIEGLGGQDILSGGLGNDTVLGGTGHDRIWGRRGDDLLYGGEGHDQLNGGADQDSLWGEADNDQLCGNLGDDWLNGGLGNDTLTGGGGRDTFVLAAGHGNDLIRDFQLGEDSIGLAEGLSFEQLSLRQKHSQTWVVDTAQGELLARLDGVDATLLTTQAATTFVLM
jgi:predicted outer membrane repeat protein